MAAEGREKSPAARCKQKCFGEADAGAEALWVRKAAAVM